MALLAATLCALWWGCCFGKLLTVCADFRSQFLLYELVPATIPEDLSGTKRR